MWWSGREKSSPVPSAFRRAGRERGVDSVERTEFPDGAGDTGALPVPEAET